jgi:hypothetical protein
VLWPPLKRAVTHCKQVVDVEPLFMLRCDRDTGHADLVTSANGTGDISRKRAVSDVPSTRDRADYVLGIAQQGHSSGVVKDAQGVADFLDNRVRRVDRKNKIITTVAGNGILCSPPTGSCGDNGLATQASLSSPAAIFVDAAGITCGGKTAQSSSTGGARS